MSKWKTEKQKVTDWALINATTSTHHDTALSLASRLGHLELVRILVDLAK